MDEIDKLNKRVREVRFPKWKWPADMCPVCGWPYRDDGCQPGNCSMRPVPARKACDDYRDYGHDIAAAWELINEMQQAGVRIQIDVWLNGYTVSAWIPGEQLLYKRRFDSLSANISRCYLAWSESQNGKG
jgi:hypothetical protein